MRLALVLALFAVGKLAVADEPAPAVPDEAAARADYQEGMRHYALAEYAPALAAFKAAYLKMAAPAFLYNIAQCHRQLGQKEEAAKIYRNYLQLQPDASDRAEIEGVVADLEREIAHDRELRQRAPQEMVPPPVTVEKTAAPARAPTKSRAPIIAIAAAAALVVVAAIVVGIAVGASSGDARLPAGTPVDVRF